MSFKEKVMSWLPWSSRVKPATPPLQSTLYESEEKEVEERLRNANAVSDKIAEQLAKVSDQQQKRTEDIKVVMHSVMKRTGTVVDTAEEALSILNRAGRH